MPKIDPKIWAGRTKGNDSRLDFSFPVSCTKAAEENGKYYITFIASDTDIDLHTERFTENAINDMVRFAKSGVELIKTHFEPFGMAITTDAKIISQGKDSVSGIDIYQFEGTAELDMRYVESQILFDDIKSGKNKRQLSVGGYINWEEEDSVFWEEYEVQVTNSKSVTLYVLAINKFYLDHIAVTRANGAANPRTGFVSAIVRTLDDDWMKKHDISPSYDHIDQAIKQGAVAFKHNLGWLNLGHSQVATHKSLELKTANGYSSFPLADESTSWSFTAEDANKILGDSEDKDWKTYKKVHFWYDPENTTKKSGFKLPFAKKFDGEIKAVWKGCAAAMSALLGARGGVDIPEDERKSVYGKISAYYKKFGKESPEFKTYSFEEFVSLKCHEEIKDFLGKYKFYFEEANEMEKNLSPTDLKDEVVKQALQESQDRQKAIETQAEVTTPAEEKVEAKQEADPVVEAKVETTPAAPAVTTEVAPATTTEQKQADPAQPDIASVIGTQLKAISDQITKMGESSNNQINQIIGENQTLKQSITDLTTRIEKMELKSESTNKTVATTTQPTEVEKDRFSDCFFGKLA